jgi:hypothetical protein
VEVDFSELKNLFSVLVVLLASTGVVWGQLPKNRIAKPVSDTQVYSFANNGPNKAIEWMAVSDVTIIKNDISNLALPSRPQLDAQQGWNSDLDKAPEDKTKFLSWACWNLLQVQQPLPGQFQGPDLKTVCSHLEKRRAYIVHIVHWARVNDKFSLRSNDWYVYKAKKNMLVQTDFSPAGEPVLDADTDALLFGIHLFDAVSDAEKPLLNLVYTATATRTVPQNLQNLAQVVQALVGATTKTANAATSQKALVIVGLVPGAEQLPYKLALTSSLGFNTTSIDSDGAVVLPGHTLSLPEKAIPLERTPQFLQSPLFLTIVLNRANEAAFESFVSDVNNPDSERFGRFITQQQLAEIYGPTQRAYEAVRTYLERADLKIVHDSPNRLTISFIGGRELIERAFAVTIQDYKFGERTFYATKNDPSVPASVAPYIQAIVGLSNLALPHPGIIQGATQTKPPDTNPLALATAYNFGNVGDGKGQTIGLLEYDSFNQADLETWLTDLLRRAPVGALDANPKAILARVTVVPVEGGSSIRNPEWEGEVLLDLEVVIGMAPGATYAVYEARDGVVNFHDIINSMINDKVTVISNSWSDCESTLSAADLESLASVFAGGVASGISAFNATGDDGVKCSTSGKDEVVLPADVPSAMGVGGTTLSVGKNNSYASERWWPQSGFGVSGHFLAPPYLRSSLPPGVDNRPVPDFAADGDTQTGISVYQADKNGWYMAGGTSMSVPIWAAAIAVMNQRLGRPSGLVVQWVSTSAECAKALHIPRDMAGANNDFQHLGFGSIDLSNLVRVKQECTGAH